LVLLARLLRDGKGVARDLDEARGLLRIAASLGHDVTAELRALRAAGRGGRKKVSANARRRRKS
jgi:TPR repeat protein